MDGLGKMVDEMIQKRMQDQYARSFFLPPWA